MFSEHENFAEAIGLNEKWPIERQNLREMSISGYLQWAEAYLRAAIALERARQNEDIAFFSGPLTHVVGLANELLLKTILRGGGVDEKDVRKISHNTYAAYLEARKNFEELKFIQLVMSNTKHLGIPKEIEERLQSEGHKNSCEYWRFYPNHLRILDLTYDKPHRSRYMTPGEIVMPEPQILLVGAQIFRNALRRRLDDTAQLAVR
jgi:hypothetical protein